MTRVWVQYFESAEASIIFSNRVTFQEEVSTSVMFSEKHMRSYRFQAVIFIPSVDVRACGLMQTIGKYIACVPVFSQYLVHKPITFLVSLANQRRRRRLYGCIKVGTIWNAPMQVTVSS
jgi:hypothetical protein